MRVGVVVCGGRPARTVVSSTNPGGGPTAWTASVVDSTPGPLSSPPGGLDAVSCRSASLCVAVHSNGDVLTSTDPAGGSGAWSVKQVAGINQLTGIACPSRSLCVAVDNAGKVVASRNPTHPGAWSVRQIDGVRGFLGVSCPSPRLCVAADNAGNVASSTDPAENRSWSVASVDGPYMLNGISCPSASLCVAVDNTGNIVTSTNPAGVPTAWTAANIFGGHFPTGGDYFESVSCPSTHLCVATDIKGQVVSSTHPTGGPRAWIVSARRVNLDSVSCPSRSLCVAGDSAGTIRSTAHPTGPASGWVVTGRLEATVQAISCPSTTLCVAVDNAGTASTSTKPGRARSWASTREDVAGLLDVGLLGVSCSSNSLCVAVDAEGNAAVGNPAPTIAQIRTLLQHELAATGHAANLIALLRHGYSFSPKALSAGRLVISWYLAANPARARLDKPKPGLIATGTTTFTAAGTAKLKLVPTHAATQLLNRSNQLTLTAEGSFTPTAGRPVFAAKTFTLKR